jgi:hypothetical protein
MISYDLSEMTTQERNRKKDENEKAASGMGRRTTFHDTL